MFFLGAGASVPAGINGVVGLVKDYKEWLAKDKSDDNRIVEQIENLLQEWLIEQDSDRKVNIELLLETIERLENIKDDPLIKFFDDKTFKLSNFKGDGSLSRGLKQCIREKCFIPEDRTCYLEPLLDFLNLYNILQIFSTNYDNSIEQFASSHDIRYEVGFDAIGWNPDVFKGLKNGIRLYKIHGSITSWKTEEEDYNNLPIRDISQQIQLSSGKESVPAILYAGTKLEYSEPIFDTIAELKQHLRTAKFVFVIGYSFNPQDAHITRVFQYAAKKNRKLIVILVTPSAFNIYNEELRHYKTEQFKKTYSGSSSSNPRRPSKLDGRVICLPYRIENVLPKLKERYLDNLKRAESLEEGATLPGQPNWKERLKCYTDCEHIEKVDKIIDNHPEYWNRLVLDDLEFAFKINLKALLNRLLSEDKESENRWRNSFKEILNKFFLFDRVVFTAGISWSASFPAEISLQFRSPGVNVHAMMKFVTQEVIPIIEDQLELVKEQKNFLARFAKVNNFLDRINRFRDYLNPWSEQVTFERYRELRGQNHHEEVEELFTRYRDFAERQNAETRARVIEIILQIEQIEIRNIYGGDVIESL